MSNRKNNSQNLIPPLVRAIHTAVKGRARFKVESLQGSEALKEHLEFRLAQERDIDRVRASCQTGNILVEFNPNCSLAEIASLIARLVRERKQQGSKKAIGSSPGSDRIEQKKRSHRLAAGSGTIANFTVDNGKPINDSYHKQNNDPCWHTLEASAIVADFQTSKELGLSNESVREKLKRYGPNLLEDTVPRSGLSIFVDQFKSVPVGLLTAAALLSVATGGLVDAAVIMGVVTINAIIGYATESQSDKIIRSLKSLVKPSALAIRNGQQVEISARDIVLGDSGRAATCPPTRG
jgi:P-type Ca2+ transporter type 2C